MQLKVSVTQKIRVTEVNIIYKGKNNHGIEAKMQDNIC